MGDVLEAFPPLVAVERVATRHYKHYRGYSFNRTWGILWRSAKHETANAPSGIAGVGFKGDGPQYAYIGAYEPGTGYFSSSISIGEMGGAYNLVLSVDTGVEDEAQSLLPPHLGSSFSRRR